jgi:hypothetical protein
MNDNKFWLTIWLSAFVTVTLVVLFACTYYSGKNDLIAKSSDPIATACAMDITSPVQYTIFCQEKAKK